MLAYLPSFRAWFTNDRTVRVRECEQGGTICFQLSRRYSNRWFVEAYAGTFAEALELIDAGY